MPGGLLRYGIPDFKMEKHHIDRRIDQMAAEGVTFFCGVEIGVDKSAQELIDGYDAVLLADGCEVPRDPGIPGRELAGVHDAMAFLVQQNKRIGRENIASAGWPADEIWAGGKHVVVVGGGDTASDCIGTSFRQGAVEVTQLDIRPEPPEKEDKMTCVALLGDEDAHVFLAGRGRAPRVCRRDARIRGQERPADRRQMRPGR